MDFHLGDVLSITTDRLLSPVGIGGVQQLLEFMTGDAVMTHQMPRVADECRPFLLAQHPQLAEAVPPPEFTDHAHVYRWLADQVSRYGVTVDVQPLAAGVHVRVAATRC